MRTFTITAALAALTLSPLGLAACSEAASPPVEAEPVASESAPASAPVEALLEGDGLTPPNAGGGGTALKLAFGMNEAEAATYLTGLYGAEPVRSDCADTGLSVLTFGGYLDLLFEAGALAGWTLKTGAPEGFSTLSGVHIGATLAEVRAAIPEAQVTEASVGPEFALPEQVFGFLSGTDDAATVTGLYAGRACIFR